MDPLPKLAVEVILIKPGMLRRTSSCGSIISDSTSLGAEARQGVWIEISGRSISGVIWIGKRIRLRVPNITTRIPATITATGFPKDIRVRIKSKSLVHFQATIPDFHRNKRGLGHEESDSGQIAVKQWLFEYLTTLQLVIIQVQIRGIFMEYDYIIVGAGSAGCVMANRLSENPSNRVLLLEAGGPDNNPFIHMPAGLAQLATNTRVNWGYQTETQPGLNQRRMFWPRGKVLGGSSSINAMIYIRGQAEDYDYWESLGNPGWGFDGVLPFFLKSQDQQRGKSSLHGTGGPLSVQDLRYTNPLSSVFLKAAIQAGYSPNDDFNASHQAGVGFYQVTQRNGKRCSSAVAFLKPALKRPNLDVLTGAFTEKVLIEAGQASGVVVSHKGKTRRFFAGEIILCGGAINSPQLLMLSGVGPAEHLRTTGVQVQHDLQGVGQNLQDHLDICTLISSSSPDTYDKLNQLLAGLKYLFGKKGPVTSNLAEAGGFVASSLAKDNRPDIQFHFVPAMLDDHGRNILSGRGMTIHACALRPHSRGEIRLDSDDPRKPPIIQPNYLRDPRDLELMLEGMQMTREVFMQEAFDSVRNGFIFPEEQVKSEAEKIDFIRRKAETIYHPVGTCKMGNDPMAVVDSDLRVHGVDGLRVVDASIMPELVSGNTNAPAIMIAEKCAESIIHHQ